MSVVRIVKKINVLLSRHQKNRIIQLAVLMLLGGALETCSVGLIIPFIDAVVNIDTIMDKWYVQMVCRLLQLNHPHTFLFVVATSLGVLFVLKNAFLLFEYNMQYRFAFNNQSLTQKRILRNMINKPYEFFLGNSSGEAIRLINQDVPYAFQLLQQILFMFTELVVSAMLIVTIFLIIPGVTFIIAGILLILLFLINKIIKPVLRAEGERTQSASAEMNKWLLQSIQGIKEVKVMGIEDYFSGRFYTQADVLANCRRKQSTLTYVPRYIIEAVCMSALFFVIAVLIITGSHFNEIMPMLSAVAMASIRLLPSVSRISATLPNIAYYEPMLDSVMNNMSIIEGDVENYRGKANNTELITEKRNKNDKSEKMDLDSLDCIDFHEITYHYPGKKDNVLEQANVIIRKGEAVGIVGESGAGKTTVVDIMLGLMAPQKGEVLLNGRDIQGSLRGWHESIGYIPQMIFMLDGTVRENVVFGRDELCEKNDAQVWRALDEAALGDFVRGLPDGLDTAIGERGVRLSGGQRQRIGIARALFSNPEILVFDEATSALDHATEAEIMKSVYDLQGSKTMIIIAHILSTIERCDHVYRVESGKIVAER